MIRVLKQIKGCSVRATNGDIGKVTDCYFDDEKWAVRYLVVDTGGWLAGRNVLISPMSIKGLDLDAGTVHLNIDRDRVQRSPNADLTRPISRQYETEYYGYYGYPYYWPGVGIWGAAATPGPPPTARVETPRPRADQPTAATATGSSTESHLRSAQEVAGYHIRATDQEIGHIEDFLAEADSWRIDEILIDTSNLPGGKPVTLRRERIERIELSSGKVFVNATSQEIKESPKFTEEAYTRR